MQFDDCRLVLVVSARPLSVIGPEFDSRRVRTQHRKILVAMNVKVILYAMKMTATEF